MTIVTKKKQLDPNAIPLPGEFERARIYKRADEIQECLDSWSKFDKLKAYEDMIDCIELIEDHMDGPVFDILMRVKLNAEKIFDSKKAV